MATESPGPISARAPRADSTSDVTPPHPARTPNVLARRATTHTLPQQQRTRHHSGRDPALTVAQHHIGNDAQRLPHRSEPHHDRPQNGLDNLRAPQHIHVPQHIGETPIGEQLQYLPALIHAGGENQ